MVEQLPLSQVDQLRQSPHPVPLEQAMEEVPQMLALQIEVMKQLSFAQVLLEEGLDR